MHERQTIVINDPGVCQSAIVCLPRGKVGCAKKAERIDVLFGLVTPGGRDPPYGEGE